MSHSAIRSSVPRALAVLWCAVLGSLALTLLPPAASAAVLQMSGADEADEATGPLDLVSAKVDYDTSAGKATVTVQTAASSVGVTPMGMYALLGRTTDGRCVPDPSVGKVVVFTMLWDAEVSVAKWILSGTEAAFDAPTSRSGTTVTSTAGPDASLKNLDFDCAQIQTKTDVVDPATGDSVNVDVDYMNVYLSGGGSAPVFTTLPDKDKDGVPDTTDKCPTVAGGDRYGCLTIASKKSVRLGRKRVAIDKMVRRTAQLCPIKAKAKVTLDTKKGKKAAKASSAKKKAKSTTLGSGVVSVTTHGSYCRVYGVVKLKKTMKKRQKVKIVVKASGMTSISAKRKR